MTPWKHTIEAQSLLPWFLLIFIIFQAVPVSSKAENRTVTVNQSAQKVLLGYHTQYLENVPTQLNIEDISSPKMSDQFLPNTSPSLNFGSTDSTSWIRFTLEFSASTISESNSSNKAKNQEWLLFLGKRLDYYDDVKIFSRVRNENSNQNQAGWETQTYGLYKALKRNARDPACFKLFTSDGGQIIELYLRVRTVNGFFLKPTIYSPEAYREFSNKLNLFYGLYYGLAFSMIIYNLFHYFFMRDKVRLLFIMYAMSLSAYFFVANELSGAYLPIEYLESTRKGAQFLILLTFIFCIQFAIVFLDAKKIMPKLYRLLQLCGILSAAIIIMMPFFSYLAIGKILLDFSVIVMVVVLAGGIVALYRGYQPAKFFLLAWVFLLGGGFIYVLNFRGVFPYALIGDNAAQAGSGIEMVLLSLAIADRVRFLFDGLNKEQEKRETQLIKLTHQLVQTEERERRKIARRLHDSIGQILCASKWEIQQLLNNIQNPQTKAVSYLDYCINETRSLTSELYPQELYQFGLQAALVTLAKEYLERFKLDVTISVTEGTKKISEELQFLIFRAVSELLNNIRKHAKAQNAEVILVENNSVFLVSVRDDGIGFDYSPDSNIEKTCIGLFSIQERLSRMGGELKVERIPAGGSEVVLRIPIGHIN